jgi:AcrR family transcriptional regulator
MKSIGGGVKLEAGRQAAYKARTRLSLLKSAQQVLAEVGLSATIEDLANKAQVSPVTIYNHFETKEAYLKEALDGLWQEQLLLAYDGRPVGQDLETMIEVCRKLFRVDRNKTLFGKVMGQTLSDSAFVIQALRSSGSEAFKSAAQKSGVANDDFETKVDIWAYCLAGIFHGVFVSKKYSAEDADAALRMSLAIWGLSKSQAEKLTSKPIG